MPLIDPLEWFERLGLLILFVVVAIVFSLLQPETFATAANWRSIATTQVVPALLALALLPPLICGRFDVSVGANMAACSLIAAAVMSKTALPLAVSAAAGVLCGAGIGTVNGVLVSYLGVNSIVGTLAMATIIGGVTQAATNSIPISSGLSQSLTELSIKDLVGIPAVAIIALVVSAIVWFTLTQTPYGRRLTAIGVNLRAARLTGMRVNLLVLSSFAAGGGLAGVAGVMLISVNGSADPSVAGVATVIPSLAAAFLGATAWEPGRYNVPGTLVALLFIGATTSGLALLGTAPWVSTVFNGTVVVLAVALAGQIRKRRTGTLEIGA